MIFKKSLNTQHFPMNNESDLRLNNNNDSVIIGATIEIIARSLFEVEYEIYIPIGAKLSFGLNPKKYAGNQCIHS